MSRCHSMGLLDSVTTRLGSAPSYRCELCATGYERDREHCTTCGCAAVRRSSRGR